MPELTLEFDVYCSCGEGLCGQTTENRPSHYRSSQGITVEPCQKCLDVARDEGYVECRKEYEERQP